MSYILVNDIFDELFNENKRLLNELKFTEKCIEVLNEIKVFFDSNSNEIKLNLVSNQLKVFNDLCERVDKVIEEKNSITYVVKEESVDKTSNQFKTLKKKVISKPTKILSCDKCFARFRNKNFLEFHNKIQHNISNKPEICDMEGCNKQFTNKKVLDRHKKVTYKDRPI